MTEGVEITLARIDERTANIQNDISDIKDWQEKCSDKLVDFEHRISTNASDIKAIGGNTGTSKKQIATLSGSSAIVGGIITALVEFFTKGS
jgi:translation initiation factor 2B subunit (eIF-2B alpha/beta/delta family)